MLAKLSKQMYFKNTYINKTVAMQLDNNYTFLSSKDDAVILFQ